MIKNSIVSKISLRTGLDKNQAKNVVETIIDSMADILVSKNDLKISRFGTFKVSYKESREGRNPQTLEKYTISPRYVVTFRASKFFREQIAEAVKQSPQSLTDVRQPPGFYEPTVLSNEKDNL